jgi:hypothetical protein
MVEPNKNGLPRARLVLAFPALLLLLLIVLVGFGITGSSTGVLHNDLGVGADPDLIAGTPQTIRSDEWFVQTSWTISQVEQGLPIENESFPGGMDATVQHDLPSRDWSVAFRPHLLGFFFLPLDNAMALKWWLPGFALMAVVYLFVLTMLPRRPVAAAAMAVGMFFAPFVQWWYLSATMWTIAWTFVVMATALWLLRSDRILPRVVLPAVSGYLTVTMGMGIYVPFIVPAVLVALAFVVGVVVASRYGRAADAFRHRLTRMIPLVVVGVAGVATLVVWILTRLDTIEGFVGTVYPGERLQPTGAGTLQTLAAMFSAPFTGGLAAGSPFDANQSEASTFFLVSLFLIVPLAWLLVRDRRAREKTDWLIVALLGLLALLVAFVFVPGWDAVAHALFLDRTTVGRARLAFGLLSLVMFVVLARRLDERTEQESPVRWPGWVAGALALGSIAAVALVLRVLEAPLLSSSRMWIVVGVLAVASVVFVSRGAATVASLCFLGASLLGSAGVNPVYHGVWDTNRTELVQQMKEISADEPGQWVGVGSTYLPTVVLVQSGLESFNGFQSSPAEEMWGEIDPTGRYEDVWNRLANVSWVEGHGQPVPSNPAPDQIRLSFDSCAPFAEENVAHVLSDKPLDQGCLDLEESVVEGHTTFWLYDVVAAP